jgi:hypothetical protein
MTICTKYKKQKQKSQQNKTEKPKTLVDSWLKVTPNKTEKPKTLVDSWLKITPNTLSKCTQNFNTAMVFCKNKNVMITLQKE